MCLERAAYGPPFFAPGTGALLEVQDHRQAGRPYLGDDADNMQHG